MNNNNISNTKRNSDSISDEPIKTSEKKQKKTLNDESDQNRYGEGEGDGVEDKNSVKGPSKVLHVRNLPSDCTEQELVAIASPFGLVNHVLILKGKNQAFIEMEKESSAQALLDYYSSIQANIRMKSIFFQFSNRAEINSPQYDNPTNILLVSVLNLVYPVTIDVLHKVFSKFGHVHKIVIFQKKAGFQSLIQYGNTTDASSAKKNLDNQNIYSGCCTLRVQYSTNLTDLNIKMNTDKARDYINNLPNAPEMNNPNQNSIFGQWNPEYASGNDYNRGMMNNNSYNSSMNPGMSNMSGSMSNDYSGHMSNQNMGMTMGIPGMGQNNGKVVCFVRGLDPERITPEILFTLFGHYGNVIKAKVLFSKPDTGLIQFQDAQQCQTAIYYLNGCPLHDKKLICTYSNIGDISTPRNSPTEDNEKYTKDYTNSSRHRFRGSMAKAYKNICGPSQSLHVSYLDPEVDEEMLRNAFSQYGKVEQVKFLANEKKMAIVTMESIAKGVDALINLHNTKIDGSNSNIRISFSSKNTRM